MASQQKASNKTEQEAKESITALQIGAVVSEMPQHAVELCVETKDKTVRRVVFNNDTGDVVVVQEELTTRDMMLFIAQQRALVVDGKLQMEPVYNGYRFYKTHK